MNQMMFPFVVAMGKAPPKKASKKPHFKSKGGCKTCKSRHIKCDEVRPLCNRCRLAGYHCEGYPERPSQNHTIAAPPASKLTRNTNLERYKQVSIIQTPISAVAGSSRDEICFQYFRNMTLRGRETPGFSRFDQIMLQLAHSESTVWHSLQAIASMFYALVEEKNGHSPKQSQQKTFQHYNRALRLLTCSNPYDRPPIEVTLICCYVFFNIEILLKHEERAISHLHGGMQILRHWKMASRGQDAANYTILAPKFYSTVSFAFITGRILSSSALLDENAIYLPMRDNFPTIREARISLLEITSSGLQSARAFEAYKIKRQVAIEDAGIVHEQAILRRLQNWFRKFDNLLAQMNTASLSASKIHEIDVLRLSARLALIWIPPRFNMSELKYDDFVQDFSECLDSAKVVYDQALKMVDTVNRAFLRDHFQSVYMIILRCRNPTIRHEALHYLKSLRSEGFWQSSLMTRVAERVVEIEEESPEKIRDSTGAPVPIESSRIHDINIIPLENDSGARMVQFRSRINWKWVVREERFMLIPNDNLVPRPPPDLSSNSLPATSQNSRSKRI